MEFLLRDNRKYYLVPTLKIYSSKRPSNLRLDNLSHYADVDKIALEKLDASDYEKWHEIYIRSRANKFALIIE